MILVAYSLLNDKRICREQIQKIEQGMGRGVRSNNDYCVVVFMGDIIVNQDGDKFFSKATFEQYHLSRQLWEQLMESGNKSYMKDIFDLAQLSLNRDQEWVSASKATLSSVEYEKTTNVDSVVVAKRKAFEKDCIKRYGEAFCITEKEKNENKNLDDKTKDSLCSLWLNIKTS